MRTIGIARATANHERSSVLAKYAHAWCEFLEEWHCRSRYLPFAPWSEFSSKISRSLASSHANVCLQEKVTLLANVYRVLYFRFIFGTFAFNLHRVFTISRRGDLANLFTCIHSTSWHVCGPGWSRDTSRVIYYLQSASYLHRIHRTRWLIAEDQARAEHT